MRMECKGICLLILAEEYGKAILAGTATATEKNNGYWPLLGAELDLTSGATPDEALASGSESS
jgi:hypothetical protein